MEITLSPDLIADPRLTTCIGMLFRYPIESLKAEALEAVVVNLPFRMVMPCSQVIHYEHLKDIPTESTPCPCGNPNHWFVKYEKIGAQG